MAIKTEYKCLNPLCLKSFEVIGGNSLPKSSECPYCKSTNLKKVKIINQIKIGV